MITGQAARTRTQNLRNLLPRVGKITHDAEHSCKSPSRGLVFGLRAWRRSSRVRGGCVDGGCARARWVLVGMSMIDGQLDGSGGFDCAGVADDRG